MLSFRTERSVVKNPGSTKVDVHEILRNAQDDKIEKNSVKICEAPWAKRKICGEKKQKAYGKRKQNDLG